MTILARIKKNTQLQREMSSRLKHIVVNCLQVSIEQCSSQLGYSNSSALRKAMAGNCFIDPEKLKALSDITNFEGMAANIHWLITGDGQPMLKKRNTSSENEDDILGKFDTLSPDKKAALITLLN